jgi:imidazole glycerol phosphate synthase subunit HisF
MMRFKHTILLVNLMLPMAIAGCVHTAQKTDAVTKNGDDYIVVEGKYEIKSVALSTNLPNGKAKVKGYIKFAETDEYGSGGIVKVIGQRLKIIANENGYYEMLLNAGDYKFEAFFLLLFKQIP